MFCYKLYFLIFLILFVVCFSYDNQGGSIRKLFPNGFTVCMHNMTEAFGRDLIDTGNPMKCIEHAIINMKLYGPHRTEYPVHVAYYYQEFGLRINYDSIILPKNFCVNEYRQIDIGCFEYLKIFQDDMSALGQQNILTEFDSDDVKFIMGKLYPLDPLAKPSGSTQGESSSSKRKRETSSSQSRSVVPPSQKILEFTDEELELLKNVFPDITQEQSSSSKRQSSSLQREYLLAQTQLFKRIILMNALYYHKVGEVPEGVEQTDESRKFFHKKNSLGDYYLKEIATAIRQRMGPRNFYNPRKYCHKLYPGERIIDFTL